MKRKYSTVLNIKFDTFTMDECLDYALTLFNEDKNHIVVTPNPIMVMDAKKDKNFEKILNDADLCLPDGIGVVYASRLYNEKISERVGGCDFTERLFDKVKTLNKTVYILGAGPGVAKLAKENIEKKYEGLKVVGFHDGYFSKIEGEEDKIKEEIRSKKPDILLVGLGGKTQENWIYNNKDLPVKISIGVGGTIDVLGGTVKRAPEIWIKLKLEWLYRILKEPKKRIKPALAIPLFILTVLKEKFLKKIK